MSTVVTRSREQIASTGSCVRMVVKRGGAMEVGRLKVLVELLGRLPDSDDVVRAELRSLREDLELLCLSHLYFTVEGLREEDRERFLRLLVEVFAGHPGLCKEIGWQPATLPWGASYEIISGEGVGRRFNPTY